MALCLCCIMTCRRLIYSSGTLPCPRRHPDVLLLTTIFLVPSADGYRLVQTAAGQSGLAENTAPGYTATSLWLWVWGRRVHCSSSTGQGYLPARQSASRVRLLMNQCGTFGHSEVVWLLPGHLLNSKETCTGYLAARCRLQFINLSSSARFLAVFDVTLCVRAIENFENSCLTAGTSGSESYLSCRVTETNDDGCVHVQSLKGAALEHPEESKRNGAFSYAEMWSANLQEE